jgi:excisionase family DNA binding protein
MTSKLMTAEDLAERWGVPRDYVHRLAREGRCPVVKLGRYHRFRPEDIEAFERAGGTSTRETA